MKFNTEIEFQFIGTLTEPVAGEVFLLRMGTSVEVSWKENTIIRFWSSSYNRELWNMTDNQPI